MNFPEITAIALLMFCPIGILSQTRRPFYIIGHMVNSIDEIDRFVSEGSNVLESDVQFFSNGTVKETYHGFPCDCGRYCESKSNLKDYLKHIRDITDPNSPDNYYEQLVMHVFDLKLKTSKDTVESGRDIARHILNYLWSEKRDRPQEMRVLISFDDVDYEGVVTGLRNEFERQGQIDRLQDVGFDISRGRISSIEQTFARLKVQNVFLGDGITNCIVIRPTFRLRKALAIRDSYGFIDKVYQWTVDLPILMRRALYLRVDGMITNKPARLLKILQERNNQNFFRLATLEDNPFQRYAGE